MSFKSSITFKSGDLLREDAEALVNTVNCVGVMGRGIALQFKKAFPENNRQYEKACRDQEVQPGRMFVVETGEFTNPKYIVNFPTKRHWRGASRIEDIRAGLQDLRRVLQERDIHSIAIPPLGAGLGGLNWSDVKTLIVAELDGLDGVEIRVFEPLGAPGATEMVKNRKVPRMTAGRAAMVELMRRYLDGLLDPFVTLLEIHKLMYFMQEAGEELRLNYEKGPYAREIGKALNHMEGHLTSGYADGGDDPAKLISLVPGADRDAVLFLENLPETRARFERVAALAEGFESPYGLELLSTVHWVVTREGAESLAETVSKVHAWNPRKQQFTPRQIHIALRVLSEGNWIASHT